MRTPLTLRRLAGLAFVASSLFLAGCLLSPGKFTAELTLRKGGEFAFFYDGEIAALGLSQLARMGANGTFEPECWTDEGETRPCSEREVAEQRPEWDANQSGGKAEKEQFLRMMGGLDPADPESAAKLADALSKQAGFERVVHKGDGVYDVRFAASGRLTHAFVFPLVEKLPAAPPFVTVSPRADGSVRVEAAGFGGQDSLSDPGMAMMMGAASRNKGGTLPTPVLPDGTFTIRTDGRILANNTDEGPATGAGGMQTLRWEVTPASKTAPMALVELN
ncbi:hypothetical protein EKN06_12460 [Croceicoccus ponticola]|uniref:Lipoprotein n=1 Tax=Croceicoccus ponticola TaxID=2217664 RepID=A0A437GVC6_9SPHN|nr:hypothetical protein [Croceicoccus ponticola]RVQ65740.1 hypothetical protein EKN06_12460 [Croceicoccus ponticola]